MYVYVYIVHVVTPEEESVVSDSRNNSMNIYIILICNVWKKYFRYT